MDEEPYRRKYGVIFRRHSYGPSLWGRRDRRDWVNDGGRDAPMGPRDKALFRAISFVAALVALALIVALVLE